MANVYIFKPHTQKSFKSQDAFSQYFEISLSLLSQATKIVLFSGYASPFPKSKIQRFSLHHLLFQMATWNSTSTSEDHSISNARSSAFFGLCSNPLLKKVTLAESFPRTESVPHFFVLSERFQSRLGSLDAF